MHLSHLLFTSLIFIGVLQALPTYAQGNYDADMQAFADQDGQNPPPEGVYLFTGSSSVRMWKSLSEDFPERPMLNRGFGGSTFADLIHYIDEAIFRYQPKVVFVYEGDNDLGKGLTPEQVQKDVRRFYKLFRKKMPNVPLVFICPKPSISRWEGHERYLTFNRMLKKFTQQQPNTYYLDVWTPMTDDDGEVKKDIFIEDNLHMNAKGYDIWEAAVRKMLENIGL